MPVVYRENGYVFFSFSDEGNEPPHIHVRKGAGRCKWWLDPLELERSRDFSPAQLRQIAKIVEEIQDFLLERWHEWPRD